jgi:hypothetical protein
LSKTERWMNKFFTDFTSILSQDMKLSLIAVVIERLKGMIKADSKKS